MNAAPGPLRRWVLAARPRTLPAATVPVVVGAALVRPDTINWLNSILCLVVALALQIGTNYANDYSDGVRGTDTVRVGPFRLTASKLTSVERVRNAAFAWFALAGLVGLWLSTRTSWWLVLIGASAVLAGWFYTGGPRPYGYFGFGELFVFVYFGIVATVGTAYVQHETIPTRAWWLGIATGAMACALLEANNLRDVEGDREAGKKTLAARLGRNRGSWLYMVCILGVVFGVFGAGEPIIGVFALAAYFAPARLARSTKNGRELLPMLKYSSQAQLLIGAALTMSMGLNLYWR
jgi:1,4-dihydroxy-2-naphthoate octaprenyltransferase